MGIEPTCETACAPHNGFEDRDRHQVGTHFPNGPLVYAEYRAFAEGFAHLANHFRRGW